MTFDWYSLLAGSLIGLTLVFAGIPLGVALFAHLHERQHPGNFLDKEQR